MYNLIFTKSFDKRYKEFICNKDQKLEKRIDKALVLLKNNPFCFSLKSHKVNTKNYGVKWASRVTGDLRIIWDFANDKVMVIILLDIGGHSGKDKVYK